MKKWDGGGLPFDLSLPRILLLRRLRGAGRVHARPGEGRLLRRAELEFLFTTAGRQAALSEYCVSTLGFAAMAVPALLLLWHTG